MSADRIENREIQLKRMLVAHLVKAVFPFEAKEEIPGTFAKLDEMIKKGRRPIGLVPHFSMNDFLVGMAVLLLNTKEARKRPFSIPLAVHQKTKELAMLTDFTHIQLHLIETLDSRAKERALKTAGKPIPWKNLAEVGVNNYLMNAMATSLAGGIVLLSPQGGRRPTLEKFRLKPLQTLDEKAQEMIVDNLALFAFGYEVPNIANYTDLSGLNIRTKYLVTMGPVLEREKIDGKIDDWGYQEMLRLAPPAYKPQKSLINT